MLRASGFMTPESTKAGYRAPVGHLPFDTRKQETEECYGGFNQLSWQQPFRLTVEHARPDQGVNADLQTAGQAVITPMCLRVNLEFITCPTK